MNDADLDRMMQDASKHDTEFLYYLLGSQVIGKEFQPQNAGDAAEAGKGFFKRWHEEFQQVICKKGGVYEQFVKGMVTKKDLPKFVAIAILTGNPSIGGVLVTELIAIYLGLLVFQTGIAAYCAGYKEE